MRGDFIESCERTSVDELGSGLSEGILVALAGTGLHGFLTKRTTRRRFLNASFLKERPCAISALAFRTTEEENVKRRWVAHGPTWTMAQSGDSNPDSDSEISISETPTLNSTYNAKESRSQGQTRSFRRLIFFKFLKELGAEDVKLRVLAR